MAIEVGDVYLVDPVLVPKKSRNARRNKKLVGHLVRVTGAPFEYGSERLVSVEIVETGFPWAIPVGWLDADVRRSANAP